MTFFNPCNSIFDIRKLYLLKKFKFLDIDGPLDYVEGDEDFDIVE